MNDLPIRKIIELILSGQIRIPAFQRGFVWDAERVAFLMDSIYKKYPFGAVILWRTKTQLKSEHNLGPFQLPNRDPAYPIDYVLDGQQRLTSIFGVFQTEVEAQGDDSWTKIYFDLDAEEDVQESQFIALSDSEVDPSRHFPIGTFFDVLGYREATEKLSTDNLKKIDQVYSVFKEAMIPVQQIETDSRDTVAIVFERVNRMGMELDTFQLLSAWTWSEEFSLQTEFTELGEELQPFGFSDMSDDINLLLRCCSAVTTGDASPSSMIRLNGADVRAKFDEIKNGIKGSIDFLRSNLQIQKLSNLPYSTMIVPLTAFFASPNGKGRSITNEQRKTLIKWFWRSAFTKRYSAGTNRYLKADIEQAVNLRNNGSSKLADITCKVEAEFFLEQTFGMNTVHTKTFILLLAQNNPRSFISGNPVTLSQVLQRYNKNEFHHLFPKAYLNASGKTHNEIFALVNFAFISSTDNKTLGGVAPSIYKGKMQSKDIDVILEHAYCPGTLFTDDFDSFKKERVTLLVEAAQKLIK